MRRAVTLKEWRNGKYVNQYSKTIFIAIDVSQSHGSTRETEPVGYI